MPEPMFGDTWKAQGVPFWDGMWAKHHGSPMTEAILDEIAQVRRVIEIGCGAGHLINEAAQRGWTGEHIGIDISLTALDRARSTWKNDQGLFICADFLDIAREWPGSGQRADLVVSRGVLQHQIHWMPMVVAALRFAHRVVMGIGYTTDREDRHLGGWNSSGHYDVLVSIPRLRAESAAAGLPLLSIMKYPNVKRPGRQEAIVVFGTCRF